jgi:hypothetical protein
MVEDERRGRRRDAAGPSGRQQRRESHGAGHPSSCMEPPPLGCLSVELLFRAREGRREPRVTPVAIGKAFSATGVAFQAVDGG